MVVGVIPLYIAGSLRIWPLITERIPDLSWFPDVREARFGLEHLSFLNSTRNMVDEKW